jgi:Mg-chelatase subunit ChlD
MDDKVFRARLSSIMLDNKYDRRLKGRTRGKLDMKALYKVPTLARSVFTQKQSRKNKEYHIVLLVDASGSMEEAGSNGKSLSDYAVESCQFLIQSFEGININTAVIGFSDTTRILKNFQDKPDFAKIRGGLAPDGGTPTVQGLNLAYHILRHKKGDKIVLLLTDGQAGGSVFRYRDENDKIMDQIMLEKPISKMKDRNNVLELVDKHKDITTIGVGIQSDCSKNARKHIMVDDVADLKPKLIEILKKEIKRG